MSVRDKNVKSLARTGTFSVLADDHLGDLKGISGPGCGNG